MAETRTRSDIGFTKEGGRKVLAVLIPPLQPRDLMADEGGQASDQESIASSISSVSLDSTISKPSGKKGKGRRRGKRSLKTSDEKEREEEGLEVSTRKRRKQTKGRGVAAMEEGEEGAEEEEEEEAGKSKRPRISHESVPIAGTKETETARGKVSWWPQTQHVHVLVVSLAIVILCSTLVHTVQFWKPFITEDTCDNYM